MRIICHVTDANHKRRDVTLTDVDPHESVELLTVLLEEPTGIDASLQRLTSSRESGDEQLLATHRSLFDQGVRGEVAEVHVYHKDAYEQQRSLGRHANNNGNSSSAVASPAGTSSSGTNQQDDAARLIAQLFASGSNGGGGGRAPTTAAALQPSRGPPAPPANADALITQLFAGGGGGGGQRVPPHQVMDPDDPEYQRRLYEAIQRQNLEENLANAIEHTPEAFARVVMLYVPCTVNNVPLTAFVDSGAQMSVMSERMAEKCGIMRLLDRRMQGVAKGVGTCRILGKVHMTMVSLGGLVLPFSITVLERQDMDFLIGLDQLKRHQMIIDLKTSCLRIDEQAIPFLSEGELPEHLRKESAGEQEDGDDKQPAASVGTSQAAALPNSSDGGRAVGGGTPPPQSSASAAAAAAAQNREAAAASVAPQATPLTAAAHAVDEEKVQRLQEMTQLPVGIIREALIACNGSEDAAAMMLLEG